MHISLAKIPPQKHISVQTYVCSQFNKQLHKSFHTNVHIILTYDMPLF
uniref:Uncharacterized protein n=1 Tax=Siphoviridae sp. ct87j35 TaxID=2825356 RepID=A0A8S5V4X8_9CAUD|nr:MAG TPA: hypothetical protein [Siphoviridae sp. ct87j35]